MRGRPKSIAKRSDVRVFVANETPRAMALAKRVRKRLDHQLTSRGDAWVPDEDWRHTAAWYSRTVVEVGRLVQSDLGEAVEEKSKMTDEEYAAELDAICIERLQKASDSKRRKLLRDACIVPSDLDATDGAEVSPLPVLGREN